MVVQSPAPSLSWVAELRKLAPRARGLPWNVPRAPGPRPAFLALRASPASENGRERWWDYWPGEWHVSLQSPVFKAMTCKCQHAAHSRVLMQHLPPCPPSPCSAERGKQVGLEEERPPAGGHLLFILGARERGVLN